MDFVKQETMSSALVLVLSKSPGTTYYTRYISETNIKVFGDMHAVEDI